MERVPSGIPGLDDLIGGGFPAGSTILIEGPVGSGKSVLVFQSLYMESLEGNGAIYLPFDETPENIRWNAENFRYDLKKVQGEKKLLIYYLPPEDYESFLPERVDRLVGKLKSIIETVNARKLAIDSMTTISFLINDPLKLKLSLRSLNAMAKETGIVLLLTANSGDPLLPAMEMGVDGVISLEFLERGNDFVRTIRIRKMRATDHPTRRFLVAFGREGMVVLREEEIL